jgi:hypothetical protein
MWQHLTLYPDVASARRSQIVRDILVVALVILFVWVGVKVHDLVAALAVLGHGVPEAGSSVQGAFDDVSNAVARVPVVGGPLGDAFHGAGSGTGGNLASLGQQGEDAVYLLARTLGIVTALLPVAVLLVAVLPRRIRGIREMSSARAVSGVDLADPERRRLLAMRAAFGLPYRELLPWTKDPFGDLASGNYDALVAAALADVGLRLPTDHRAVASGPAA